MNVFTHRRTMITAGALAIAAMTLSLSGTSANPAVAQDTTADTATAGPEASGLLEPLPEDLDPDRNATHQVTVVTGHTYTLQQAPDGSWTGTPQLDPALEERFGPVTVRAEWPADSPEPSQMLAVPDNTQGLIDDGKIDARLFDLLHLVEQGHTSKVPVTVHYNTSASDSDTAQRADKLAGSDYVDGSATDTTATVTVNPQQASAFWDAVTEPQQFDPDTPQGWRFAHGGPTTPLALADDITGLSLDGAPLQQPAAAQPQNLPLYDLTVRIHALTDNTEWAGPNSAQNTGSGILLAVDAPFTGAVSAYSHYCEDPRCLTVVNVYRVPAGTYMMSNSSTAWLNHRIGHIYFEEPEIDLRDNLTMNIQLDDAVRMRPSLPKETTMGGFSWNRVRSRADGSRFANAGFGVGHPWRSENRLVPSQTSATVGQYSSTWGQHEMQRKVEMRVVGGGAPIEILPEHQWEDPKHWKEGTQLDQYFNDGKYPMVDAGYGQPSDLQRVDVNGKVALMEGKPNSQSEAPVSIEDINRLKEHGAVGVIVDTTCSWKSEFFEAYNLTCVMPTYLRGKQQFPLPDVPAIPVVTVSADDAAAIRERMSGRAPIEVDVLSTGDDRTFRYEVAWSWRNRIPSNIELMLDERDFAKVVNNVHDGNLLNSRAQTNFTPMDVPDSPLRFGVPGTKEANHGYRDGGGTQVDVYYGPLTPDLQWDRYWWTVDRSDTVSSGEPRFWWQLNMIDMFLETDVVDQAVNRMPASVGPVLPRTGPDGLQLGDVPFCNFCRVEDTWWHIGAMTEPQGRYRRQSGYLPNTELRDSAGNVVPTSIAKGLPVPLPVYDLPTDEQQYTFTSESDAGTFHSEWSFTSGHVPLDGPESPGICVRADYAEDGYCGQPVPMIYLRYDAPLGLDNRAQADTSHELTVIPYHQGPDAPAIEGGEVEISFDGGESWASPGTSFDANHAALTVSFDAPPKGETNGWVAVRTHAFDEDGNTVDQTMLHAYELR